MPCQIKPRRRRKDGPAPPPRTKVMILAELSADRKRELLFKARSLLAVGLWTHPPKEMIKKLIREIDKEIDRNNLVGCDPENPLE